ncbi:MAG: hypothetical protein KDA47_03805 [Planctomycetales bacterium]|nr:hypothetical protein [Planctomycetales bacterium]
MEDLYWRQSAISSKEYEIAKNLLDSHGQAYVNLGGDGPIGMEWLLATATHIAVDKASSYVMGYMAEGMYQYNHAKTIMSGDMTTAAKQMISHDLTIITQSQFSPLANHPMEQLGKLERTIVDLSDPGPDWTEAYNSAIDPNYQPCQSKPNYMIPLLSEMGNDVARHLDPEANRLAGYYVVTLDTNIDLVLTFVIPAGMAGFADDAARLAPSPGAVVDKSYKLKIHGTAQRTGTPGHQFRMYREAITEAKKPNVTSVHLDHGYNRALNLDPKTISPNRRPDVVSIYDNRSVLRVEVQSKTDLPAVLRSRNSALDQQLIDQGFTPLAPRVVRPTSPSVNFRQ